jgi:mono/diheme cytochrome c family protein
VAKPATEPTPPPAAPVREVAVEPGPSSVDPRGKILFEENCRKCHGVRGVPPRTMKAKFAKIMTFDDEFLGKRSSDSIVTVLTKGASEDMRSFKDKLSRDEMGAVAAYIRSLPRMP